MTCPGLQYGVNVIISRESLSKLGDLSETKQLYGFLERFH